MFFEQNEVIMKNFSYFMIIMLLFFTLSAEDLILIHENSYVDKNGNEKTEEKEQTAETDKSNSEGKTEKTVDPKNDKNFFTCFKFGIGADFSGTAGMFREYENYVFKNQFGASLGFDFNWLVFKKESGRGEGNLYLGFGFNFQYWMPTTWRNKENRSYDDDYYYDEDYPDFYIMIHYMRIPVTLNLAYELKAGIGALKSVEPRVSLGINNNIFKFGWGSSDKELNEELSEDLNEFNHRIYNYKISGTWSLGLSFVFENNWFFSTSIGGDFGSSNYRSNLFYERAYERDEDGDRTDKLKSNKYGRFLYGHHEFLMFETGYRF